MHAINDISFSSRLDTEKWAEHPRHSSLCMPSLSRPRERLAPMGSDTCDAELTLHYAENFFGADFARRLVEKAGLGDACGTMPAKISRTDFWMLCLASINEANDENHGCTSRSMPKSSWTMVFSAVNQMETIGAGLRRFVELVPVIPSGLTASLGYGADCVKITYGVGEDVKDVERAERYAELMALVFHCVLLWGAGRPIRPLAIRLSERLSEDDGSMADILSPFVTRSGEGTTVTYAREDLTHPLGVRRYKTWASHETAMFLELVGKRSSAADGEQPVSAIVSRLRNALNRENLSQQEIARSFGMSVATLQRRLAESGHSFREVSREIRVEKLRSLLATDSSLDDIAVQLGFSERRSLWRACQDWLGVSPAGYRRTLRHTQTPREPRTASRWGASAAHSHHRQHA